MLISIHCGNNKLQTDSTTHTLHSHIFVFASYLTFLLEFTEVISKFGNVECLPVEATYFDSLKFVF